MAGSSGHPGVDDGERRPGVENRPSDSGNALLSAAEWDARYQAGNVPWDTGIVPPEVQALVASEMPVVGWAVDIGCGTGVSSRFLAEHGFHVIGVDLALTALRRAVRSAAHLSAYFCLGNAADLGFLAVRAVLALDVGCFHALPRMAQRDYIRSLARILLPSASYLLYAFEPQPGAMEGPTGIGPADLAHFAPYFTLRWAQHGRDRNRPAAWYLFRRTAC